MNFKKRHVVITGGSTGIGFSIAKSFAMKGANLHLIARNKENLIKSKKQLSIVNSEINIETYAIDLKNLSDIERKIQSIGTTHGIDLIINNAGVEAYGKFEDLDEETLRHVFEVNYWGAVNVTRAAIPFLKKSPIGNISFVSSVAGYLGACGYVSYAPTKFALTGFAECLRMEMKPFNISVNIVFPPDTDTNMYTREKMFQIPEAKALSKHGKVISPDIVADKLITSIINGKFEVLCNKESIIIKVIKNIFPYAYYRTIDKITSVDLKH
ncbi:SDR family NAD(P)-dependent oxidoreductase [Vibrio ostreicida]|uniref:SDR family NAD(P)-dependent oxidoreductase n=1 Tax=Vibrio ostreicida TaxID=526588 RepID=A0ABT8C063_9VIBR|nr:SDR family NAD(P)-dependent oxidoreductase [Vibrio ostreicida]MDN3612354.1 SDR family NAD(P)-dependent oxidoreductase [Vibrio ostreicida]NPD09875.1 SDR family NAD(P)-dependent oxidoreductase [Vibrio ostreicida]